MLKYDKLKEKHKETECKFAVHFISIFLGRY